MNRTPQYAWWTDFAVLYTLAAAFFGGYSAIYFRRRPVSGISAAAIYGCLILLLGSCLAPGFSAVRSRLRTRLAGVRGGLSAIPWFLFPYLVYSAGTGDFHWIAFSKVCALAALPLGLFAARPVRTPNGLNWQDAVVLLWLLLSILGGELAGIWSVPENLDFMARLFLLGVGSWSFLIVRGVETCGYEFRVSMAVIRDALLAICGFAVIALPLGFELHFLAWNPQWRGIWSFLFDYATIFLFIALLEEFFFRGVLQNLLEGSVRSRYGAQAVAAVIFGMSHIRHAPFPNWRYVALASIAGWFYGGAYRAHRSLMASSLAHAMVDTLWRTFLTPAR